MARLTAHHEVAVSWFGKDYVVSLDDLARQSDVKDDLLPALRRWALEHCAPSDQEVRAWGGYRMWSPHAKRWVVMSKRPEVTHHVPVFGSNVPSAYLDKVEPQAFHAQLSDTIIEITSQEFVPSAFLSLTLADKQSVVAQYIDINDDIHFMVRPHSASPVLVGHSSVLHRLSEVLLDEYFVLSPSSIPDDIAAIKEGNHE